MRIATWNVNSVRQRIENLTAWLTERAPDIVCLQETKTVDDAFPRAPIEALGYNVAIHVQKTFNGVAILSKFKFDERTAPLPGAHDAYHTRLTEARRRGSDDKDLATYWDYQAGASQQNSDTRIDHLVLSPQAADRLITAGIDKHVRSWERPSDHVPVYADFAIDPAEGT